MIGGVLSIADDDTQCGQLMETEQEVFGPPKTLGDLDLRIASVRAANGHVIGSLEELE